jgi:cell division protein FtsI (penicillin-binding protein 3)
VTMSRINKRIALFMGFALLFLVALLARAFFVQVVAAPGLQDQAENQHVRTVQLDAPRGTIYDRDGEKLAVSQTMASVYANPSRIENPGEVAKQLAPILERSEEELVAKLSGDSQSECLARKINKAAGDEVEGLRLPDVWVVAEDKRIYPKGALAPQLLGFVGTDNEGLAGIECQYEDVLRGIPGTMEIVSGLSGNRLSTVSLEEAIPGRSITLTIDEDIQFETEKVLTQVLEQFEAKRACAVVLEPGTGEILAMANTPVFDTNDFSSVEEVDRRNMVVNDQYEPGSTFKMVVTAAALEEGLVTPETTFTLGRDIQVYDRVVHESHAEGVPKARELTVTQILAQSSNVGAVTLGLEVGKTSLVEMIRRFGFTEKLGIDFPGEADGQMLAPEKWSGTTIANVPIGQGIAASPLQLLAAYAAVANDGQLVQPHLVRDANPPWKRQVVSPLVASELRDMLTVTVEDGTGKQAQVRGYEVAGKTGTAQKVKVDGSGYAADRYIASFVGMVPANAPRLVILVMVDEPATQHLGAYVAAPAFAKIADFSLKCLGIGPSDAD